MTLTTALALLALVVLVAVALQGWWRTRRAASPTGVAKGTLLDSRSQPRVEPALGALGALAEGGAEAEFRDPAALRAWEPLWHARLAAEGRTPEQAQAAMRAVNPAIIPRNHRIEAAIEAAVAGDLGPFRALEAALARPFDAAPDDPLRAAPAAAEAVHQTFCGT